MRAETLEKDHAPLNLARVRLRLKRAGWHDAYLFRLLNF